MLRSSHLLNTRRGGLALPALIALPIILLALVSALSGRLYLDIKVRMQAENDAASLAGGGTLASDAMLRGRLTSGANSAELFALLQSSRQAIRDYAQFNPVYGDFSKPEWDLTTPANGEIIFGKYDRTLASPFTPVPLVDSMNNPANNLQTINSVRVFLKRTNAGGNAVPIPRMPIIGKGKVDAFTVATALLDNDVIGFRPLFTDRPVPLVPIALDLATVNAALAVPFTDGSSYNPATGTFIVGGDGLPEISVDLTTPTPPMGVTPTAATLNIGQMNLADFLNQITGGVNPPQLAGAPFNGAFILQPDNMTMTMRLAVPGSQTFSSTDGSSIDAALDTVAATPSIPRVWPIYNGSDMSGQPIVVGFIAARLISSATTSDIMGNVQAINLKLQPTMMVVSSAVTNPAFRGYAGVPSLTVAKLRLVP